MNLQLNIKTFIIVYSYSIKYSFKCRKTNCDVNIVIFF